MHALGSMQSSVGLSGMYVMSASSLSVTFVKEFSCNFAHDTEKKSQYHIIVNQKNVVSHKDTCMGKQLFVTYLHGTS